MTSPPLNAKPRSEEEAMFDTDHARHRKELMEIAWFLSSHEAPQRLLDTLNEVYKRICDQAAARILERSRNGT